MCCYLRMKRAFYYKISAWTMDAAHAVLPDSKIPKINRAKAIDGNGKTLKLKTEQGRLSLDLNTLPQYISLSSFPEKQ